MLFTVNDSRLNFLKRFLTAARAPPASFKIIASPRQRRHSIIIYGAKTAFQTQASAKQSQTFESCLSGVWKMKLPGGRSSHCPPQADWDERFLFWKMKLGRSSLASNSRARSGHNFWQVCFWSCKNHWPAERRERTDARPERHL